MTSNTAQKRVLMNVLAEIADEHDEAFPEIAAILRATSGGLATSGVFPLFETAVKMSIEQLEIINEMETGQ